MTTNSIVTFYSAYKIKEVSKTSATLSLVCIRRCNSCSLLWGDRCLIVQAAQR